MKTKIWEDRFKNYWHETFGTMSSEDYIKYKDVGKCQTKQGFQAGYQLAQKELEEQLREAQKIIEYVFRCDGQVQNVQDAIAFLEKWK